MVNRHVNRRVFLAGAAATLALTPYPAPAQRKGASLRLWILKTYVEPTNKAIEASAQRWAQKHGGTVSVEPNENRGVTFALFFPKTPRETT